MKAENSCSEISAFNGESLYRFPLNRCQARLGWAIEHSVLVLVDIPFYSLMNLKPNSLGTEMSEP